jgi:hypothetical protein
MDTGMTSIEAIKQDLDKLINNGDREQQRAEILAAKLRELGIDPDSELEN